MALAGRLPTALRRLLDSRALPIPLWLAYRQTDRERLLPLELEKTRDERPFADRWRALSHFRLRRYISLVSAAILLTLWLTVVFKTKVHSRPPVQRKVQTLHFLVPATNASLELCRTVLSAEVLQYPTPALVQWEHGEVDEREEALRRMTAVRDSLFEIAKNGEDDLVILSGGPSTWFQLRPEVLLKRYYDILRRENRILVQRFGGEFVEQTTIANSVVFPASWVCGAASPASDDCQPETRPLSEAVWQIDSYRYPGQGPIIGPAKDLHEIYRRAVAIRERSKDSPTDLEVLTNIFATQEHQRKFFRPTPQPSSLQRLLNSLTATNAQSANSPPQSIPDDFRIALDTASALSLSTSTSSSPQTLLRKQASRLPPDIAASMPPLWTPAGYPLPAHKRWTDLTLLTGARSNTVPVAIHLDAGDTAQAQTARWEELWLHAYGRDLFNAHVAVPTMPLAGVLDHEGVERVFWGPAGWEKAGVRGADGKWQRWEETCRGREVAEGVFGDGKGDWRDPRF